MGLIFSSNNKIDNQNRNISISKEYPNSPDEYDELLEKNIKKYQERDSDIYPLNIENKNIEDHIKNLLIKILSSDIKNLEKRFPKLNVLTNNNKEYIKENINSVKLLLELKSLYKYMFDAYNAQLFIKQILPMDIQFNKLSKKTMDKYKKQKKKYGNAYFELMDPLEGEGKYELSKIIFALIQPNVNFIELSNKYKKEETNIPKSENIKKDYDMFFYIVSNEDRKNINNKPIPKNIQAVTKKMNKNSGPQNIKYNFNRVLPSDKFSVARWISYIKNIKLNKFIGIYYGYIYIDSNKKLYSTKSMIKIDKEFQNKRLCRPFASYTYGQLKQYVDYIKLLVSSKVYIRACSCYVNAALNINLDVYIYDENEKKFIQFKDAKDCQNIKNRTELYFINPNKINIKNLTIT